MSYWGESIGTLLRLPGGGGGGPVFMLVLVLVLFIYLLHKRGLKSVLAWMQMIPILAWASEVTFKVSESVDMTLWFTALVLGTIVISGLAFAVQEDDDAWS